MPPFIDLTGRRFTQLVVLERAENRKQSVMWMCRCDCGVVKPIQANALSAGAVRSCGCYKRDQASARKFHLIHGHTSGGKWSAEFRAWSGMKTRCYNEKEPHYQDYGGRGIVVCQEWLHDFQAFLLDVGLKPHPDMSLDRIDNDGHYEPGNVRWATKIQQARNRRAPRTARPVVGAWLI